MKKLTRWAGQNVRQLLSMLCLLLALLLLLGTAWEIRDNARGNSRTAELIEQFNPESRRPDRSDQYLNHVPMEQMDLSEYDFLVDTLMGGAGNPPPINWELPNDVVYYQEVDGKKVPALTLEKGTVVSWPRDSYFGGYGFYTFPTYEAGWRYAVPFTSEAVVSGWEKGLYVLPQTEYDYYYVRLEDLKPVVAAAYKAQGERGTPRSVRSTTLLFDEGLVRHNTFISADLRASISPAQYLPNLTAAALCLLAALLLFRAQPKHPR